MRIIFTLLLLATTAFLEQSAIAAESIIPYTLPGTEVRDLHARNLNRDYQLYISLPKSYATSHQNYPVVFVTDAPYAFPLIMSIEARITGHSKKLPEFILVGLAYAKGDTAEFSRRRDYTPTPNKDPKLTSDMPGRAAAFGEAEAYRRFIADQVFPFIATNYRADMSRKIFAGHSYGSLFGAYVLLTDPTMFSGYVLGSPSLWYDHYFLFKREREFAATIKDLAAKVYVGVGAFEGYAPKNRHGDTRYSTEVDMVADSANFAHALAAHHYPGLQLRSEVIADEDHLTVAPILITHGLLWVLGSSK